VKVLVTGFDWFGDLVPFVVHALDEIGEETSVVLTSRDLLIRTHAAALSRIQTVPIVGPSVAGRWRSRLTQQAVSHINDQFRREVDRLHPDFVLSILCWGDPLSAESLAYASRARRIGWLMDDPFGHAESRLDRLLNAFDRLYSPDDGWSDSIERMTGTRPVWLPCGADPRSQRPLDPSDLDPELTDYIVYVGSSCVDHPTGSFRRALLESLKGLPLAIFGDAGWKRYGGFVAASYRGGPVDSARANVIYASSAIALNFHHPQFRRGTSLRTFALCCSGAFQLADWRDGLDRWLTPGVELETFRTPAELRTLAERYLADATGRRRIAAAGRARVLAEHTYQHRLRLMFNNAHAS
jgi:hypothetical protein